MNTLLGKVIKIQLKNLYWDLFEKRKATLELVTFSQQDERGIICRDEMGGLFSCVEICRRKSVMMIDNAYMLEQLKYIYLNQ